MAKKDVMVASIYLLNIQKQTKKALSQRTYAQRSASFVLSPSVKTETNACPGWLSATGR